MGEAVVKDLAGLAAFAERFVASRKGGGVVGLTGDLGAGKTTFVRACIAAIAKRNGRETPRVTSPSYTLQQVYSDLTPPVEHFDLYRLENLDFEGLVDLGYAESVERMRAAGGFLFVEWPEKARDLKLLDLDCRLDIKIVGDSRKITETR